MRDLSAFEFILVRNILLSRQYSPAPLTIANMINYKPLWLLVGQGHAVTKRILAWVFYAPEPNIIRGLG